MAERSVLVAYGTTNGSTAEIAEAIGAALREDGFRVDVAPAADVEDVFRYQAVLLGGAVYLGRWHPDARHFARRYCTALRGRPVWLFSSGPIGRPAAEQEIPPVPGAARAMRRLWARGHATFGGRITEETKGWIARTAVQQGRGGDFRDFGRIREWAHAVAAELCAAGEDLRGTSTIGGT
jgi:menaquinone-dependent protoporphyrinogen oxidase